MFLLSDKLGNLEEGTQEYKLMLTFDVGFYL